MQKKKFTIEVTEEQFTFLNQLIEDTALELDSFKNIRPGDDTILYQAELAKNIELSLHGAVASNRV